MAATAGNGKKTYVIQQGDNSVISNFGGVGTGNNPSAAVLAEVDVLKFEGEGLTAENMILTQQGDDLFITFEGVGFTQVVLKDFDLEDLENLSKSAGASVNVGNILFNGQSKIQDSFDVINANQTLGKVSRPNVVTFLNDLNNTTQGLNNSDDVINGQGGNDQLEGFSGNDVLKGGDDDDILKGGVGNDTLSGDSSYDVGDDILYGGDGNDILYGDSGFGGYSGDDILYGGDGDDILDGDYAGLSYGGFSSNTLYGGDGNDTLYSTSAGKLYVGNDDVLYGGDGNDTYVINGTGDAINEEANAGIDTVKFSDYSADSYTLGNNLENLTLATYGSFDVFEATGNSLNNIIIGNDSNEFVSGSDSLSGKAGNDTLNGLGDNDTLNGGAGTDTLTGSSGKDQFVFSTKFTVEGIDTITDFSGANAAGGDVIVLDKTAFTILSSPVGGPLLAAEFASVANDSLAGGVSDDIVFSRATGNLFYNQNGTAAGFGTGDQFAILTGVANLAATDFLIQA